MVKNKFKNIIMEKKKGLIIAGILLIGILTFVGFKIVEEEKAYKDDVEMFYTGSKVSLGISDNNNEMVEVFEEGLNPVFIRNTSLESWALVYQSTTRKSIVVKFTLVKYGENDNETIVKCINNDEHYLVISSKGSNNIVMLPMNPKNNLSIIIYDLHLSLL